MLVIYLILFKNIIAWNKVIKIKKERATSQSKFEQYRQNGGSNIGNRPPKFNTLFRKHLPQIKPIIRRKNCIKLMGLQPHVPRLLTTYF